MRGDVLRRGDLTVRTHAQCAAQTPAIVDEASVLCARDISDGGTTMCFGDSGSPSSYGDTAARNLPASSASPGKRPARSVAWPRTPRSPMFRRSWQW
ncbi:trypsin-like serine protease [Streptomyces sp. NPDC048637]|uniref:trypsin-like serine protease n=1 Tax=Streptomyces sp. NPDC048637 TaxID=3155636 RepID=UPI0034411376